jgi:pimeloyl-ACP methyl ester carboxylesterase
VTSVDETLASDDYAEFAFLSENAAEWNLPYAAPRVERGSFQLASGLVLSYLQWGTGQPELVMLHGGAQNAHTWDTLMLAVGRPAIAVDLPGHGHSDRRDDRNYGPWQNSEAVAALVAEIAPNAKAVVGMSLGGATAMRLAATRPDLCRRFVLVDVTPQINDPSRALSTPERGTVALIAGPPTYDSFEAMADAAIALSPLRAASGVRRGVRHNAVRLDDGRWAWRYDLFGTAPEGAPTWTDFTPLWDDVEAISVPGLFVRGGMSPFVLDEDVAEMRRRLPGLEVAVVDGAGHAVQSDQPLLLARLLEQFVPS